jgi:hypothetical protein
MPRPSRLRKPRPRWHQFKVLLSDADRDALQRVMMAEGKTAAELFRSWIHAADDGRWPSVAGHRCGYR